MGRFNTEKEEEVRTAEFNESQLKTIRVHRIQDQINLSWINPLAYNGEYDTWNYEVIFRLVNQLWKEVAPKLREDDVERTNTEKIKKGIEYLMSLGTHSEKRESEYPHKKIIKLNLSIWKILERELNKYEEKVRFLIDKHGLGAKDSQDTGGL